MVLVPWARDQGGVAARAAHLGVAEIVDKPNISSERLAEAAHVVLNDNAMAATVARVSVRLRETDPVATACKIIEQL